MIQAIILDLDDTLYDHAQYVKGAYADIAQYMEQEFSISGTDFFQYIFCDWQRRTSQCRTIFTDALRHYGIYNPELEDKLVSIYRQHRPTLSPYAGVKSQLRDLQYRNCKLGLLTDGQSQVQRRKINTLGLTSLFDAIIATGDLGRQYYKPHGKAYRLISEQLKVSPASCVYVGDNPRTDFAAAKTLEMLTIRIKEGEYKKLEHAPGQVDRMFPSTVAALAWCLGLLDGTEKP
jgi:putative hydrolase of the HAD superfamily